MKVKRPNIQPKWKVYLVLILAITIGTIAFDAGTLWAAYPTEDHRNVAAKISELDNKSFGSGNSESILNSDEYTSLQSSIENIYSVRMGVGSGILSVILGIAIVVGVYRYLRINHITKKPVGATVIINTAATVLATVPVLYLTPLIMGTTIEPMVIMLLAIAAPFAIAFSALVTFFIARITERHYNRSHGFVEE